MSSRILIVEDQEDVAQLIDIVLKNEGYTVAIARDGAQGLMLARDWKPDLILMDIMLPGVDGGKLISRLRKEAETRELPIVAMSASRTLRDRTPELEADALLAKPFDVDALLVQVQFLLSRERGQILVSAAWLRPHPNRDHPYSVIHLQQRENLRGRDTGTRSRAGCAVVVAIVLMVRDAAAGCWHPGQIACAAHQEGLGIAYIAGFQRALATGHN